MKSVIPPGVCTEYGTVWTEADLDRAEQQINESRAAMPDDQASYTTLQFRQDHLKWIAEQRANLREDMPQNRTKVTPRRVNAPNQTGCDAFSSLVSTILEESPGITRQQAVRLAARRNPQAHEAFLRSSNPQAAWGK